MIYIYVYIHCINKQTHVYIYIHTIQIQYVIINTQTYIHIPSISSPATTWRPRHLKAWALAWRLSIQPPDNIFFGWFPSIFGELFMRLVGNIPDDLEYRTLTIAKMIWWNCCCLVGALAISSWEKTINHWLHPLWDGSSNHNNNSNNRNTDTNHSNTDNYSNNNTYYIMMCVCRCVTYVIICITCYYVNNNALLLGPKKSGPSG